MKTWKIKDGQKVAINYIGKIKDGEVFDSTMGKKPFEFVAGEKKIIEGLNNAVLGMKLGEQKVVEMSPLEAFGEYDKNLITKISRNKIPKDAKVGDLLKCSSSKNVGYWTIVDIRPDYVVIDGNHPLAGKQVIYEIEVLSCRPS